MDETELSRLLPRTIQIEKLYLNTGMVLKVGDPWPGPDGKPQNITVEGKPVALKIAAIFEVAEESETATGEDGIAVTSTKAAHFEIWPDTLTEPCKFITIAKSREVWTERLAPSAYAHERAETYLTDNAVVDEPEEEPAPSVVMPPPGTLTAQAQP